MTSTIPTSATVLIPGVPDAARRSCRAKSTVQADTPISSARSPPLVVCDGGVLIQGDALPVLYRATLALVARRSRDGLAARCWPPHIAPCSPAPRRTARRRPGGTAHRLRHWYGSTLVRDGADLRTAHRSRSCSGWRAAAGFSPANFFSAESIPGMPKNHRVGAGDGPVKLTTPLPGLRPEVVALRAVSAQRGACTVAVVGWGDGRRFQPSVRGSADRQL